MLDDQATYLARYGDPVYDVGELFAAALARSAGDYVRHTLAAGLDAYSRARGLPLAFERAATDALEGRFTLGPLGYGWSHNFEHRIEQQDQQTVIIHGPGATQRRFSFCLTGSMAAWCGEAGRFRQP